ncbi:MAG: hypothetical protein SGI97_08240 [candidate division Zixibacteria bacterium]|nr:hypothetical protein [candidate division Zixibacteria bacterium]
MRKGQIRFILLVAVAATIGLSCNKSDKAEIFSYKDLPSYFDENVDLPRIRYSDGSISMNQRCIVRQSKLNLRMPPIYVNHKPIGFC